MRRLLTAACAALALAGCRSRHDATPSLQRMIEQPRADVYEASPVFPDGKVMQTPPAGTVAREAVLPPTDSAAVTAMPAVTPALLETGRSRFHVYCAACHGEAGYGGSLVALNMTPPRPPSLRSAAIRALPPATIYAVIENGFGKMPSYAADLDADERWAVVAYVKRLPQLPPRTPAERLDSARAARFQALSRQYQAAPRASTPPPPDSAGARP
ncbi:MAG TPA: cytochrome c [Longimicrobiaceae bacterium]|nr:cytochrome c [Longimicrobiaceae bacterium]